MDLARPLTTGETPEPPGVAAPASPPPPAPEAPPDAIADLDRAAAALAPRAPVFARTPPREKAALLRAALPTLVATAPEMVAEMCRAAGADPAGPLAGSAWLTGPVALVATVRRYAELLEDVAVSGRPRLPARHLRRRLESRVLVRLAPRTFAVAAFHRDAEAEALLSEGVDPGDLFAWQAAFYRLAESEGGVVVVAGAPHAPLSGPQRALHTLFVEGKAAIVETSAALAPLVERALAPLIDAGFLRVFPGSTGTRAPEMGGPAIVVPALYARDELWHIARRLVSEIAAGHAFGAIAPSEIVVAGCWAQRALFEEQIRKAAALSPLPLPIVTSEPGAPGPSGGVAIVAVGCDEPAALLAAAVQRAGALPPAHAVEIVIHDVHEEDPQIRAALERAVAESRCRTLGINQWPALAGFRGDTAEGTYLLGRVDKTIVRGPLLPGRRPLYFLDEPRGARRGARLCALHAAPGLSARWRT
jgi:hypothetical protein